MTPEQQKAIALANARKRKAEAMGAAPAAPPMSTRETERFPPQEGLSVPVPYPQRAGDLQGVRDYLSRSQAEDDARAAEREALRKRAAEAGRAETLRGLQSTSPMAMGLGGPSATLAGQSASDQVYGEAGVMSPEAAREVRSFNSRLLGLPGILNEDVRAKIGQAGQDQPGMALLGDIEGYLVPGEAAFQVGKGVTNAFARPIVSRIMPQGGSALERGVRVTGRYGTQTGAWAGQNALYQGTVGESVAAAEEGRAPSLGSAAERAGEGATDPLNALGPAALMGLNRLREFAATGGRSATPRSVAESVAANRGAPTGGSFLDAGRLGGGDVDRRAETLLVRMLRNAGYSGDDIRRGLATFDTLAEQTSDLPVLASRLKDVLIDQLGPRAEQVVQDFLQGAGVSRGGTAGQAVADAAQQDYGRLSDFLEASANARLGQGSRFDTLTAAQDEMTRIGNEGYERVFGAAPTNQEGVADLRQALDFYANSELATPLRQVAAGRMLNVEQMIEADPRRAAHWMQHTAGLRAQEAADAGNEVLARAYTDMRQQILRRLEADGVAPGYQQARMQFGDQFGIEQAVNFGSRFFTRVQDSVGVRQLAEDIRNLTPQQQEAALLSIRDELLRLAGRGREGAAPRLSQLNTESALGGLETVVGERGGQLANDIRFIDERLARIRRTDPTANSRTATNTEAREFADRAVSNPITRTIGNAINAIGGDAALASVASGGTVPPVFSIRAGMRAMGDRMARGRQGKIDDVTALLLRDYGGVPRPGMPGDAMPPLTSRGGPTGGSAPQVENAFAQTMSNQQTVPSQNAFTRLQGFGGFEGVKQVSDLVRLYKNMSGEQMRESLLDRNGPEFLRTSLMKMTLNELQVLYKNITGEVPPQGGMNDTRSAIMDALQSNRPLSTEAPAPSTKTASASSPKPDYRDENQIKIDNLVSIVKAMSPEDLVRAYGQKPTPGTSEAKGELIDFALMKMTQSELLGMYARLGGPKPDDVTMTGLRAAIVGQLRGNSANSIGLGNAFAQSVMGGAGGSAYGSRNDINGDGVIDEQDVFLGSAAGTVGVPLVMGVAGRVGNAFAKPKAAPRSPQADRMMRAREQGFDVDNVLYHGTNKDFQAFEVGAKSPWGENGTAGGGVFLTNKPSVASEYATGAAAGGDGANVLPVYTRVQNPKIVDLNYAQVSDEAVRRQIAEAKAAGHDALVIKNARDGFGRNTEPSDLTVVFDPKNIRSVNAEFDPSQSGSPILTAGLGGGGRKPPPDSPEAITDAVRGIARETPRSSQNAFVPPRGQMRGVLQMPERVPPASPMADQVPPPLPPRPVSNRVPTSNMPNATEIGLMAGTGAAIGGAFLMEKANDPATFGLASFDELPPDHPLRDPAYRQMALMAQMQPQQSQNAFASARQ